MNPPSFSSRVSSRRTILARLSFALTAALAALSSAPAFADSANYPWGFLRTATLWQGKAFLQPMNGSESLPPGFGAAGAFEVQGLGAVPLTFSVNAAYRWRESACETAMYPGAGLSAGWRFHVAGPAAIIPFAGFGFEAAVKDGSVQPQMLGTAGFHLAIRLTGDSYLDIAPGAAIPFTNPEDTRVSLALGLRRENRWLVPVSPVSARISASPVLFSPDDDGNNDTIAITIDSRHPRSAQRWTLEITADDGTIFRTFSGRGKVPESLQWNGLTSDDSLPEPGQNYSLNLVTVDKAGRYESASTAVTCDILIVAEGDGYKIRVPAIRFSSNSFTLSKAESEELFQANRDVLERIAALFLRFPDYSLLIEGHANSVYRNDPARFEREQREELLPLSEKRAETVKRALVLAGIEADRMKITGIGGLEPLTEEEDPESVAKNRRVEFILIRNR